MARKPPPRTIRDVLEKPRNADERAFGRKMRELGQAVKRRVEETDRVLTANAAAWKGSGTGYFSP